MAKASIALGNEIDNDNEVLEHMIIAIDTRARLDPPIPSNYLENAAYPYKTALKTSRLVGQEGFAYAAEEIKEALDAEINNEEGVLKGFDTFFNDMETMEGRKSLELLDLQSSSARLLEFRFWVGKPKNTKLFQRTSRLLQSGSEAWN